MNLRKLSTAVAVDPKPLQIPLEAAALACQRWQGVVELPLKLESVASEEALSTGQSAKRRRQRGQSLTDQLKHISRSEARGGQHGNVSQATLDSSMPAPKPKKQNLKQQLAQLQHSVHQVHGDLAEYVDPQLPMQDTSRPAPTLYKDASTAAAYAIMRMPACYAVIAKVLHELRTCLPDFVPASMMDFGAGPGTATWAAREVWTHKALQHRAVEAAPAMARLGRQVAFQMNPDASIVWHSELADLRRLSSPQQRQDLVVAAYVLVEMRSSQERASMVAELWRHTQDVLILIEPGTPAGSAAVRAARSQVLNGSDSKQGPCHVVAPCPHDGRCPMDGTQSWCHFVQRFKRTAQQKHAKVLADGHAARDYQDERFSYVILRRGHRPSYTSVQHIARAAAGDLEVPKQSYSPDVVQDDAERRQRLAAAATALSPEVQALIDRSMSVGDSDDDDEDDPDDEHASDTGQLPAAGPAQPRHAAAPLHHQPQHAADPLHHQHQDPPQHAAERHQQQQQHAADPGQHHRQGQHRSLQGVPQQLQEVSEDAQEVAELEGWQEQQSAADLNQADAAAEMREGPPEPHAAGMHDVDNTPIIKPEDMEAEDEEDEDDGPQVDPAEASKALQSAQYWSRIIRAPRHRRGHVIMDVCSARHIGDSQDASQGHLVRQVVGKVDRGSWLGSGGYRMVRKLRWGDLWPLPYQRNALVQQE